MNLDFPSFLTDTENLSETEQRMRLRDYIGGLIRFGSDQIAPKLLSVVDYSIKIANST